MTSYSFETDLLEHNNQTRIYLNNHLMNIKQLINITINKKSLKKLDNLKAIHEYYNMLEIIQRQLIECDEIEEKIINNLKWDN